ncbi:unnamed protein product [Rotaria sp. Silwood2]|nr:unnamed protein product [Rotaria sp. Silwood2]CAF2816183.1 unnamed protein product [Rotaria sp. Silwood2]
MPEIGSCTDITCDNEIKELYECHCCLRLVCLYHLNEHVEITKQNKQQLDDLRNELNTVINTLQLIVEEKFLTIEREQNLIEQAKTFLDISSTSIDDLQRVFEQINQTIASNRSGKKNKLYNHDQHVNEEEEERKRTSYRKIFGECPLTFNGAYGLTKANHSIKFCEHRKYNRIELYGHFISKHELKEVYAKRLIRAVADNQDPWITKLFDENENVIDHFYKVSCPLFNEQINSLRSTRQNVVTVPCRCRLIPLKSLKRHLLLNHKVSNPLAQKLVDAFKEQRT